MSAMYGFLNQAGGFTNNRAYSVGAGYNYGGLQVAAAYLQLQGLNGGNTNGALQNGVALALDIQNQRVWGLGANYAFGLAVVGAVFTQTRFQDKLADISDRYNNYEVNARYNFMPAFFLGAASSYTQALRNTPGSTDSNNRASHWNQFGLMADYSLSNRTDLYAESVAQIGANNAGGKRVVMYRPQIMKWTGNRVEGRAAMAIIAERGIYTYGVAHFSGRADICRATHHVRFT